MLTLQASRRRLKEIASELSIRRSLTLSGRSERYPVYACFTGVLLVCMLALLVLYLLVLYWYEPADVLRTHI
jgi:hypothetical protein